MPDEGHQACAARSIPADASMQQQLQSGVIEVPESIPLMIDPRLVRPESNQALRIQEMEH